MTPVPLSNSEKATHARPMRITTSAATAVQRTFSKLCNLFGSQLRLFPYFRLLRSRFGLFVVLSRFDKCHATPASVAEPEPDSIFRGVGTQLRRRSWKESRLVERDLL